tara:strand:- start:3 stop:308 length:306 start_codon:yes stop_codon:yes gene_type:complete
MVKIQSVDNQFVTLQNISNQMSELISKKDFSKIFHLDSIRKKIISDITEKNILLNNSQKNTVLKLINKNKELVFDLEQEKSYVFQNHKKTIDCHKAYLKQI